MRLIRSFLICFLCTTSIMADSSSPRWPCSSNCATPQTPLNKNSSFEQDLRFIEINKRPSDLDSFINSVERAKNIETNVVTYETTDFGVLCHVAWYADGIVATALNGTEEGKQVIIINGSITGISYDLQVDSGSFLHKYTWGKVRSYSNRQIMHFN